MIDTPTCRVRRLSIKTHDPTVLPKVTMLLEDAFRIASVPSRDGQRMYFIRRLALRPFTPHHSSSMLALAIQEHLRHLLPTAVHASQGHARRASCVFFTDTLEPLSMLAAKIARGEDTSAWFWPLAVPSWHFDLAPEEGLRTVLATALSHTEGVILTANLLETLGSTGGLHRLFHALRPQDGPQLCRLVGLKNDIRQPSRLVDGHSNGGTASPRFWDTQLSRSCHQWIRHWGRKDARSAWLAAMILIHTAPRLSGHPEHLATLVHAYLSALSSRWNARIGNDQKRSPATSSYPDNRASNAEPLQQQPATDIAARTSVTQREPVLRSPRQREHPQSFIAPALSDTGIADQQSALRPDNQPTPWRVNPYREGSLSFTEGPKSPPSVLERTSSEHTSTLWRPRQRTPYEGKTQWAGLLFLLHPLSRLGIVEWLNSHPVFLELDIVRQIFRRILEDVQADEDDSMWAALEPIPEVNWQQRITCFSAPASWWAMGQANALILRTIDGRSEASATRVLYDQVMQVPLALWTGSPSPNLHAFMARERIQQADLPVADFRIVDVIEGWLAALQYWCRSRVGVDLSHLVHRPAHLTVTPTHLDVRFRLDQVELAVRKAGLDIDPGWVPWFGRVVHFHYLDEEP